MTDTREPADVSQHAQCPSHCCPSHGCKYGYADCPVASGGVQPTYPQNNGCEDCEHDTREPADVSPPDPDDVLTRLLDDYVRLGILYGFVTTLARPAADALASLSTALDREKAETWAALYERDEARTALDRANEKLSQYERGLNLTDDEMDAVALRAALDRAEKERDAANEALMMFIDAARESLSPERPSPHTFPVKPDASLPDHSHTPTCPTCGSDDTGVMWMHQSTGDGCDTESADPFHTLNMHHPDRRRD